MVHILEISSKSISLSKNIGGDGFDNIQTADIDGKTIKMSTSSKMKVKVRF